MNRHDYFMAICCCLAYTGGKISQLTLTKIIYFSENIAMVGDYLLDVMWLLRLIQQAKDRNT